MNRLNDIFNNMKGRCYNERNPKYKIYGGRGIKMCDEWYTPGTHKGWFKFKEWAVENGYSDNLSIDRIDNNKGYSPENCRWTTDEVQANNKSNNHIITYNGKTQSIAQWSKELNIDYNVLANRIDYYHWPVKKAFEQKVRGKNWK